MITLTAGSYALLFPGQGSQYVGMAKRLAAESRRADAVLAELEDVLDLPVRRLCFEGPATELAQTSATQPCVFAAGLACIAALEDYLGVERLPPPAVCAGHSLGHLTALVAAGGLDRDDAARLVRLRGQVMTEAGERRPGRMAAIGLADDEVDEIVEQARAEGVIGVANRNAWDQSVVSGEEPAVREAVRLAGERGARAKLLPVSIGAHSPLMAEAALAFGEAVDATSFRDTEVAVVLNESGDVTRSARALQADARTNMVRPVDWRRVLASLVGVTNVLVEVGPGATLTRLTPSALPPGRSKDPPAAVTVGFLAPFDSMLARSG